MLQGPELSDDQVLDRVAALFQTYDPTGRSVRHRTAIVFEQKPPYLSLDGQSPAFLVWLVESDSHAGNTWEVQGYEERDDAEAAAVNWLGTDRRITWDQLSPSALVVLMSEVQRIAWK